MHIFCRNAIEELVIDEVRLQMKRLGSKTQEPLDLSEVAAYALNRLPPMYATTQRGWLQQRKRARNELKEQIESTVRRAMLGVRKDALRDASPLPPSELEDQARSLAALQKILGKDDLKWKDVPVAVEDALMTVKLKGAVSYTYLSTSRRSAVNVQDYLKRSKSTDYTWKNRNSNLNRSLEANKNTQELKDFASYMSRASCNFSNTLENLVRSITYRHTQRLEPSVAALIDIEEIVAYALNRLPPMYATSDRGLKQLRERAKAELGQQIMATIREAISTVMKAPARILPPLPFEKFDLEQEQALEELKEILQIEDINWRNVALIVEDALERTLSGEISWRRAEGRQRNAPSKSLENYDWNK